MAEREGPAAGPGPREPAGIPGTARHGPARHVHIYRWDNGGCRVLPAAVSCSRRGRDPAYRRCREPLPPLGASRVARAWKRPCYNSVLQLPATDRSRSLLVFQQSPPPFLPSAPGSPDYPRAQAVLSRRQSGRCGQEPSAMLGRRELPAPALTLGEFTDPLSEML